MKTSTCVLLAAAWCLSPLYAQEEATSSTNILNQSVVGYSQFIGKDSTPDYGTAKDNVTIENNTSGNEIKIKIIGNTKFSPTTQSGSNNVITLVMRVDLQEFLGSVSTTPSKIFDMLNSTASGNQSKVGMGAFVDGDDKKLTAYWEGTRWMQNNSARFNTDPLPTEGSLNLAFVCDSSGTTVYWGPADNLDYTSNSEDLKFGGDLIDQIAISNSYLGGIDQLYIFNSAQTSDQVQQIFTAMTALSLPVPEPATVGLASLGLGGLCLRRKRA